jgi:hypothetical protein
MCSVEGECEHVNSLSFTTRLPSPPQVQQTDHHATVNRCLEHVVNLANVAVMGHITKIAAVENQTLIWEYDPDLPGNCVLGGSLNVIAAIRTIAIKVHCPGFRSTDRVLRKATDSVQDQ